MEVSNLILEFKSFHYDLKISTPICKFDSLHSDLDVWQFPLSLCVSNLMWEFESYHSDLGIWEFPLWWRAQAQNVSCQFILLLQFTTVTFTSIFYTRVKTDNLLQVVNRREWCCAANNAVVNNVVTALFNHQYCYNLLTRLSKNNNNEQACSINIVFSCFNNRCFINAEQHCWNNSEQHCSLNNIFKP